MKKAFSSNPITDCTYYPESKKYAVINNSHEKQITDFYDINGQKTTLCLQPAAIMWIDNND